MDFVLVTGQPGAGKTLNTIKEVETRAKEEGRPVYYYGIPELTLDWHRMEEPEALESNPDAITPLTWYNCPDGAIIVIDEAHRIFKPHDKPDAPHIKPLSTYRHRGYSMYFISQGPSLVTSYIRDWVQPHIHYRRLYGRQKVVKYINEWVIDAIRTKKISENAQIEKVLLDKKWYGVYKSSSQHNTNKRLNKKVLWALILPIIALPLCIWLLITTVNKMTNDASGGQIEASGQHYDQSAPYPAQSHQNPPLSFSGGGSASLDQFDPTTAYIPRVAAMPETAPAYDDLRKPQTVPKPQCLIAKATDTCACYTQQATILHDYPDTLCREYATHGYFDPTKKDREPPQPIDQQYGQHESTASPLQGLIPQDYATVPTYHMRNDGVAITANPLR